LKEIYLIGIPAALESVFWQLSAMFLSKMILRYGSNAYASYQIGLQAEAITEMPAYGFGTAATTLIARAIGRGDSKSKKEYFKEMIKIGLIISSITSCLLIFFPGVFMNMMTEIEAIKPAGIMYVFIMGFVQIPQTLSRVYNGTIRAEGHKNAPMYITAIGIWGIRIPLCFLASSIFKWDLNFIWIFIALDQIVRFALSFLFHRYSGKKQLKNQQID
ncbi:MAG: MATE family efflux transporter, partial [Oscillospiraceae bacterium]